MASEIRTNYLGRGLEPENEEESSDKHKDTLLQISGQAEIEYILQKTKIVTTSHGKSK